MEKIPRQATKMVPTLRHLQYEDRQKKLGIYSLAARRLRGDLIETFKLLHGYTNINYEIFFKLNNTTETRGHNWKLLRGGEGLRFFFTFEMKYRVLISILKY